MEFNVGYPSGVPLGGIGTGFLDLLTNGKPGALFINNNWACPILDVPACFFAIGAETPDGETIFKLLQTEGFAGFQGVDSVRYHGLFPVASAEYLSSDLPVSVEVKAFSPIVPHDVEKSSYPGAVFIFRVKNLLKDHVKLRLYVSWENILGCGGIEEGKPLNDRTGNTVNLSENSSCKGLIYTTTGQNRASDPNSIGEYALLGPSDSKVTFSYDIWNALSEAEELLKALFRGTPFGENPLTGIEGQVHPAGTIGLEFRLEADEEVEIPVAFAWYMPHHKVSAENRETTGDFVRQVAEFKDGSTAENQDLTQHETDYGHYYQNRFQSAAEAAKALLLNYKDLFIETTELHRFLKSSDLSKWLVSKIINDSVPLVTNTVLTKEGVLATLEASRGMGGALGTMDQRIVSHAAYQLFFHELNRTELRLFAEIQDQDGHIPHFNGNIHKSIGSSHVEYGDTHWPDLSCSFIMQCYRDLLCTGDWAFFSEMKPHILRAYEWLKSADSDGDGVPEGGSTWDIEEHAGLFSYTGTVWLAILRIMEKIAILDNNADIQEEAKALFVKAQESVIKHLWNGEYFDTSYNPRTGTRLDDIFVGQVAGEWIARLLGLESILPEDMVRKALRSIYKNNGNKEAYKMLPMRITKDGRLVERNFSEHAWPQYTMVFVDCLAISLGMAEGMDYIKYFNDAICEIAKTPWTTTLWHDCRTGLPCWDRLDRYMNCTAAWFVLDAITGFHADETDKMLILGPMLVNKEENISLPLLSTKFWAMMKTSKSDDQICLRIDFKKLFFDPIELRGIKLRGSCTIKSCKINGAKIDFSVQKESGYTKVLFINSENIKFYKNDEFAVEYQCF